MITSPGKEFEILSRTMRAMSEGHAEYNNPTTMMGGHTDNS